MLPIMLQKRFAYQHLRFTHTNRSACIPLATRRPQYQLAVSDIRYSQSRISHVFDRGPPTSNFAYGKRGKGQTLAEAVAQLRDGTLLPSSFPSIRVVHWNGLVYSLDNRRLWVFKAAGVDSVEVEEMPADSRPTEFYKKLAHPDFGLTVTFFPKAAAGSGALESWVLSWGINDIMNSTLFHNKITPIPETFDKQRLYASAFKWHLLEEVRAVVQQELEQIRAAPVYRVKITVDEAAKPASNGDESGTSGDYDDSSSSDEFKHPDVFKRRNRQRTVSLKLSLHQMVKPPTAVQGSMAVDSRDKATLKSQDLVLLTTAPPKDSHHELAALPPDQHFALAMLYKPSIDDELASSEPCFRAQVALLADQRSSLLEALGDAAAAVNHHNSKDVPDNKQQWYIVPLTNLATSARAFAAIDAMMRSKAASSLVAEVMHAAPMVGSGGTTPSLQSMFAALEAAAEDTNGSSDIVQAYCAQQGMDSSQQAVVVELHQQLQTRQGPHVKLIQGPPGTGKTTTITRLLSVLGCTGTRTILCAPTNVAVGEVASRYLSLVTSGAAAVGSTPKPQQFADFPGLASSSSLQGSRLLPGDLLLVGNADRIDSQGPLGQLYLPSRVGRLMEVARCWQQDVVLLQEALTDPLKYCSMRLLEHQKKVRKRRKSRKQQHKPVTVNSAGEWLRAELSRAAHQLQRFCSILHRDLPSSHLSAHSQVLQHVDRVDAALQRLTRRLGTAKGSILAGPGPQCLLADVCGSPQAAAGFVAGLKRVVQPLLQELRGAATLAKTVLKQSAGDVDSGALEQLCLVGCRQLFCTVAMSGAAFLRDAGVFDVAVVDEAAQLVEAETLILLHSQRALRKLVLVGDHKQLPATVISPLAAANGYERSMFDRLQGHGYPYSMLAVQYRMRPNISSWPARQFYEGLLQNGPNVTAPSYGSSQVTLPASVPYYAFIDTSAGSGGSSEQKPAGSSSWRNPKEAELVMKLLQHLQGCCKPGTSIGLISPYNAQVALMRQKVEVLQRRKKLANLCIRVSSVDGFQGCEQDAIIISCVRSNPTGEVGFLRDYRRLNVAVTRGRYIVWLVGNTDTLAAKDDVWHSLVADARRRGAVITGAQLQ